jgi:hypothetical protein
MGTVAKADYAPARKIGALVKGQDYFVRVDAFNKNGITQGETICLGSEDNA